MPTVNLDRQIKRHVAARPQMFYGVTMPGQETLCAQELARLPAQSRVVSSEKGGVLFHGKLETLYAANLHLRTAGRILMRLTEFKATNFRQLTQKVSQLPWSYFLPQGCLPTFKVSCRHSRLYHSKAVADHIFQAIEDYWHHQQIPTHRSQNQCLHVRIVHDSATLSLDSSGAGLYQRGLKTHGGKAPLRETMAAVILILAGYDGTLPLLDPMCGTGTFSLEAALMAKAIAPGSYRHFTFEQWPSFKETQWHHLKKKAREQTRLLPQPMILASDINAAACEKLHRCVTTHQLGDAVAVQQHDFFSLTPPHPKTEGPDHGLVVLNPPYGHRLASDQNTAARFREIIMKLQTDFKKWRIALLVPEEHLQKRLAFEHRIVPIVHGGLQLSLILGRV